MLLAQAHDQSLADAAQLWGTEHYTVWTGLAETLRSGRPSFEESQRKSFLQWLGNCPPDIEVYHGAMSSYAHHDYGSLARIVNFSNHWKVLDTGGGRGELLFCLLRETSQLQSILMDRRTRSNHRSA